MFCTKHRTVPNKFVNNSLENQRLINNNWLTEEKLLTTKANVLLDTLEGYFKKSKSETNVDLMGDKYIDNIVVRILKCKSKISRVGYLLMSLVPI